MSTYSVMSMWRNSKAVVADVLDVLQRAGLEVVDADHPVPLAEQVLAEVGAEEAGAAGDHAGAHRADAIGRPAMDDLPARFCNLR